MAVQVDIPGFGLVEAKNAAEESTMKEILRALQGKGSKSSGGAGGAGGGGGAGGMAGVMQKATKSTGKYTEEINNTRTALQDFGAGLRTVGGLIKGAFGMVTTSAQGLAMELLDGGNRMSDFLQHVPLVGNSLGALTGMLEGQVDNFRDLSEIGAGFGNINDIFFLNIISLIQNNNFINIWIKLFFAKWYNLLINNWQISII